MVALPAESLIRLNSDTGLPSDVTSIPLLILILALPSFSMIVPIKAGALSLGNIILLEGSEPKEFFPSLNQNNPARFSQPFSFFNFSILS